MTAGYSGTPLAKKLGIKSHSRLLLCHQPANYLELFTDFPEEVWITDKQDEIVDIVHCFTSSAEQLFKDLPRLKKSITQKGMIWISWPKKSSGVKSDVDEDLIRQLAIKNGLVDIKVCAVNETWSGLKLVIPLKDRK